MWWKGYKVKRSITLQVMSDGSDTLKVITINDIVEGM